MHTIKIFMLITVMIGCFKSFQALAKDGSSGCGPGWYVAKENTMLSSSLRMTTNGILGPTVTLGMTFGTSNCKKHSLVMEDKQAENFLAHNLEELRMEMAMGEGSHLSGFSKLLGCDTTAQQQLAQQIKDHYKEVYQQPIDAQIVYGRVHQLIKDDKKLASCRS